MASFSGESPRRSPSNLSSTSVKLESVPFGGLNFSLDFSQSTSSFRPDCKRSSLSSRFLYSSSHSRSSSASMCRDWICLSFCASVPSAESLSNFSVAVCRRAFPHPGFSFSCELSQWKIKGRLVLSFREVSRVFCGRFYFRNLLSRICFASTHALPTTKPLRATRLALSVLRLC